MVLLHSRENSFVANLEMRLDLPDLFSKVRRTDLKQSAFLKAQGVIRIHV